MENKTSMEVVLPFAVRVSWVGILAYSFPALVFVYFSYVIFSNGQYRDSQAIICLCFCFAFLLSFWIEGIFQICCDEQGLKLFRPYLIRLNLSWDRIEKIEFILEGKSLLFIKIYYLGAFFNRPIKIRTRTFPKTEMITFCDLLGVCAVKAQVSNIDRLKP